jgi:putative membrane protein
VDGAAASAEVAVAAVVEDFPAAAVISAAAVPREAGNTEVAEPVAKGTSMALISELDAQRISEAIAAAEQKTSGEIVAVITPESGRYLEVPFLWAALVALIVPFPFIFWTWWPIQHIYVLQLAVFAVLVTLLMYPPLRLALVPRSSKHSRAHRRALEQFLAQNLHTCPNRTGVLIFVSVAERFAEIVADAGIHQKAGAAAWDAIVADLTDRIGRDQAGEGFLAAIGAVGRLLAQHFPPGSADQHVLSNHLIILPGE